MEQWRDIPGYEGIYQASNFGNVRTCENKTTSNARYRTRRWKQRVLKQKYTKNAKGRTDARVNLWKDGEEKTWLVARLVGLAWCDGYADGMTINHKDGNPLNNTAENLEWLSRGDNIRHGFRTGLYGCEMPTGLISVYDKAEYIFASEVAAARFLGRSSGYINTCIKKGRNARSVNGDVYIIFAGNEARGA